MNELQETKDRVALPEQGAVKKPYEKPQIIYRAPLEAMANVCTPGSPTFGKASIGPCGTVNS